MNTKKTPPQSKKTIYYDGTCPMCVAVISEVDKSEASRSLVKKDIAKDSLPTHISAQAAQEEIHVIDEHGVTYKNADAILQILEEYPRVAFLAKVGRWPGVHQLLQLVYRVVAANRHFIFGPASRIFWVKAVVCFGFIAGLLFSLPLWVGERSIATVPLFDFLPSLPSVVTIILFIGLIVLLFATIFSPKPQKYIVMAGGVSAIFILCDQMRLQPWVYQYLWMLGVLAWFSWRFADTRGRDRVLHFLQVIIATIYIFSGLQKLNAPFVENVFPWMMEPLRGILPFLTPEVCMALAVMVPFLEIAVGVGLLTVRFRQVAVLGALAMVAFILFVLGPFGHGWNSVVWPWNLAMACMVPLLFRHYKGQPLKAIRREEFWGYKLAIAAFVLLPVLSFWNRWDSYLSWALYSGNTNSAVIVVDAATARLPEEVMFYANDGPDGGKLISILQWSYAELNVPPYPETRVFKKIAKDVCRQAEHPEGITLQVRGKPTLFRADEPTVYNCLSL